MATPTFNLPLISDSSPISIVKDMNALANAVDSALANLKSAGATAADIEAINTKLEAAQSTANKAVTDAAKAQDAANAAQKTATAANGLATTASSNATAAKNAVDVLSTFTTYGEMDKHGVLGRKENS